MRKLVVLGIGKKDDMFKKIDGSWFQVQAGKSVFGQSAKEKRLLNLCGMVSRIFGVSDLREWQKMRGVI